MPTASRNQRRKARLKRNNTLLKSALRKEAQLRFTAQSILLAVLAQKGGEVTVTTGTVQQVAQNIARLGYTIVPSTENPGECIVRLVESGESPEETPIETAAPVEVEAPVVLETS